MYPHLQPNPSFQCRYIVHTYTTCMLHMKSMDHNYVLEHQKTPHNFYMYVCVSYWLLCLTCLETLLWHCLALYHVASYCIWYTQQAFLTCLLSIKLRYVVNLELKGTGLDGWDGTKGWSALKGVSCLYPRHVLTKIWTFTFVQVGLWLNFDLPGA